MKFTDQCRLKDPLVRNNHLRIDSNNYAEKRTK